MPNTTATDGKLTKMSVSASLLTPDWHEICIMGSINVNFGNEQLNKEWCINSEEPYISLGHNDYAEETYITPWAEDLTVAKGLGIIEAAKDADTASASTIYIQVEMNNKKDPAVEGTLYDFSAVVGGYKILATDGEIVKSEFTIAQNSKPVKTEGPIGSI